MAAIGAVPLIYAGLAAGAGSAALGGVMAFQQGQYQAKVAEQNAKYQASVAQQNAAFYTALGEQNAKTAEATAAAEETRMRRDRARRLAASAAKFGASGVQLTGSPLEVLANEASENEEAALLVRYGGQVEAQRQRLNAQIMARRELMGAGAALYSGQIGSDAYAGQGQASLLAGFGQAAGTSLLGIGQLQLTT